MADEMTVEQCKQAYTTLFANALKSNIRWKRTTWITGAASLTVGLLVGAWATNLKNKAAQEPG